MKEVDELVSDLAACGHNRCRCWEARKRLVQIAEYARSEAMKDCPSDFEEWVNRTRMEKK